MEVIVRSMVPISGMANGSVASDVRMPATDDHTPAGEQMLNRLAPCRLLLLPVANDDNIIE